MVLILTDDEVRQVTDVDNALPVVEDAFRRRGSGAVEEPDSPPFDLVSADGPVGTAAAKTAHLHGSDYFVTKLLTEATGTDTADRPTVTARIVLVDVETGQVACLADGDWITSVRTGCIGGLAARELAASPATVGVIGAGRQARSHARAIAAALEVREIRVFSPSETKRECAANLAESGLPARAVLSARDAIEDASVVVTATTSESPVFPPEALSPGAVVVAVGSYTPERQELDASVLKEADRIFADVPAEVVQTGDCLVAGVAEQDLIPFSDLLTADWNRNDDRHTVVETVGTAVLDAAVGEHVYLSALDRGLGTELPF
jgi:alanine dehydrogenase